MGHPIGCSSAFLATKALYELHRIGGRYALATMCIGDDHAIAALFERVSGATPARCPGEAEGRSYFENVDSNKIIDFSVRAVHGACAP